MNLCQVIHKLVFKDAVEFVNKEFPKNPMDFSKSDWYDPLVSKAFIEVSGDLLRAARLKQNIFQIVLPNHSLKIVEPSILKQGQASEDGFLGCLISADNGVPQKEKSSDQVLKLAF
ncbi:hypothetical protein ACH5RR_039438 [Cinchona calisaya]|uniref:Uncharacterized protein n=1 Tax=Cinchona calisaya TaxID=153742 RepID=A0ABD2Y0Z7_9GENT